MDNDSPMDVIVITIPADVHVFTEDDELDLPEADQTGDHTGGMGPL